MNGVILVPMLHNVANIETRLLQPCKRNRFVAL